MSQDLSEKDAMRVFCDALSRSASCAREMADLLTAPGWADIANMLDDMHKSGVQLSRMKAMTKLEVEEALGRKIGGTK